MFFNIQFRIWKRKYAKYRTISSMYRLHTSQKKNLTASDLHSVSFSTRHYLAHTTTYTNDYQWLEKVRITEDIGGAHYLSVTAGNEPGQHIMRLLKYRPWFQSEHNLTATPSSWTNHSVATIRHLMDKIKDIYEPWTSPCYCCWPADLCLGQANSVAIAW